MTDADERTAQDQSYSDKKESKGWIVFVIIAGVVLPAIAVLFELTTRMCSGIFDPIPTGWHFTLLAAIPISNALTIWFYNKRSARYITPLAFLQGIAIGTAFVYSLIFIPMLPISVIGIIVLGLGLFGLSPFFALWASIISTRRLKLLLENGARTRTLTLWIGILTSIIIIGVWLFTSYMTMVGLRMAALGSEDERLRGVRLIRTFGSKPALLHACYDLPIGMWPQGILPLDRDRRITRDHARTVYYQVTGNSFNSAPPPRITGFRSGFIQDFDFDSDVGGTAVNSIVKNLSLSTSRIDTVIYPDELVAYSEWTLVFTNTSFNQKEARAQIQLPPGGVVSRLTLWVNGEEREAAFASRGKVREAYQQVAVVRREDPVLVTTCGPDQVLMQCFPVPPDGGTMKVRIGITSPLLPENYEKAVFILPKFIERNFKIDKTVEHSFLAESSNSIVFDSGISPANSTSSKNLIHANLSDQKLANPKNIIICSRDASTLTAVTPDPYNPELYSIKQTLAESNEKAPSNVIIVIDGSNRLADNRSEIADALKSLPENMRFSVIQSGEIKPTELSAIQAVSPAAIQNTADKILHMNCIGGIDNRPALIQAFEQAAASEDSVILWIHGPQPLSSTNNSEQLLQLWERSPRKIKLISIAADNGRNSILAELESTGAISVCPRRGTLSADLKRLFEQWDINTAKSPVIKRQRISRQDTALQGSKHIARLWALEEVLRICGLSDSRRVPEAAAIASRYQLVTPVSGAVVLETQEQYEQADLQPADPSTVPSVVPEPSSLLALAAGAVCIGLTRLRKRR